MPVFEMVSLHSERDDQREEANQNCQLVSVDFETRIEVATQTHKEEDWQPPDFATDHRPSDRARSHCEERHTGIVSMRDIDPEEKRNR
jgi:hypothetical protein